MYYLKVFFAFLCFVSGQARSHDHARPSPMQLIQRIRGYKNQIFGDGNDIATGFNDVSPIDVIGNSIIVYKTKSFCHNSYSISFEP